MTTKRTGGLGWLNKRRMQAERRRRRTRRSWAFGAERLERREVFTGDPLADIVPLSDEFDNAASIVDWQRINEVEGWNADQLNVWDINTTQPGQMVMQPHTVVWYGDWRGPLVFKEVTGDFVITTRMQIADRDDIGGSDADDVPGDGQFSLGGLMIRTPRPIENGAADWQAGSGVDDGTNDGENYIFLSMGYANGGNHLSFEVKTTRNSDSQLELTALGQTPTTVELQIARIGSSVIVLHRLQGETDWTVHRRYTRTDMPETLQVGMVTYTDWEKANDLPPIVHNATVMDPNVIADPSPAQPFNPDLTAAYDYTRFARPEVPAGLAGLDLANPAQVSDGELLAFLGDNGYVDPNAGPDPNPDPDPNPTDHITRVGTNLSHIVDWDPAWVFKDAFNRARPWGVQARNLDTGETTWQFLLGEGPELQLDDNGWVTELPTWQATDGTMYQQQATTVVFVDHANQPAGIYRAEWDGAGELTMPYVIETGTTETGRNYALVDMPFNAPFTMDLRSTDPTNPVRNIDLWMPDYNGESFVGDSWQPGDEGTPFHPLLLERVGDFDTLRFMDWMNTNNSDIVTWDDRRTVDDATQSDGDLVEFLHTNGVAPEYMIELANEVGVNPWFNMPHQADDQFVQNFATLVRDTLDPELTIYVEWSNELWNAQFPVNAWLQDQMTLPENSGLDFFQVAGQEIQRDFDIWTSVFAGQEDRIIRVVAGQQANPWLTEQLLANVDGRVDAVSVTAYAGISYDMAAAYDATTTADDIIDDLLTVSIPWASARLQEHQTLVEQYEQTLGRDLQFVTYESGSHIFSAPNPFQTSPALDAALAAMHDPRMYDVYQTLLGEVHAAGVDLYNEFNFTSHDGANFFGTYGLLHDMTTPLEDAHQLRSLLDFAAAQQTADGPLVAVELQVLDELGQPTTTLSVGQPFTLQATVDDLRDFGAGVFSAYIDVAYDGGLAGPSGPLAFGDWFANALEGNVEVLGLIDEAGGVADNTPGDGEPVVLFSLPMIATAAGTIEFAANAADLLPDHEVTLFNHDNPVDWARVLFENVSVEITPGATAEDDGFTLFHNVGQIELDVLANDAAPDEIDSLSIVAVSASEGGATAINAAGDRVLFTPNNGFFGETTFTYTIEDAYGQTSQATVTVNVHKQWQNLALTTDVSGDGATSPIDALLVINVLNNQGAQPLPTVPGAVLASLPMIDTNGDGSVSPVDALAVINVLNQQAANRAAAGEASPDAIDGEAAPEATDTLGLATHMQASPSELTWQPITLPRNSEPVPLELTCGVQSNALSPAQQFTAAADRLFADRSFEAEDAESAPSQDAMFSAFEDEFDNWLADLATGIA